MTRVDDHDPFWDGISMRKACMVHDALVRFRQNVLGCTVCLLVALVCEIPLACAC